MKKILPVLLCYVLSASQVFALSGGPVFTNGNINPVGTYSGVLQGLTEVDGSTGANPAIPGDPSGSVPSSTSSPSNAIGLFGLGVPDTGTASGAFVLFQDGVIFTGTIQASVDPDSDKLMGILEATYNFTLTVFTAAGTTSTTSLTATAVGQINAKIASASSFSSITLGRITGTASLEIDFGQVNASTLIPIVERTSTFNVIGFKQSDTSTGTVTITT